LDGLANKTLTLTEPYHIQRLPNGNGNLVFIDYFSITFEGLMIHWFIPIMSILIPIMVLEGLKGGYTGYKIFQRVKNILNY
jgi:hypothetical protein